MLDNFHLENGMPQECAEGDCLLWAINSITVNVQSSSTILYLSMTYVAIRGMVTTKRAFQLVINKLQLW